jgi:hypothetical protein
VLNSNHWIPLLISILTLVRPFFLFYYCHLEDTISAIRPLTRILLDRAYSNVTSVMFQPSTRSERERLHSETIAMDVLRLLGRNQSKVDKDDYESKYKVKNDMLQAQKEKLKAKLRNSRLKTRGSNTRI